MIVLGLETSGQPGSVALLDSARVMASSSYDRPNSHAEQLMGHIETALRTAGCSAQQLDRIAVGTGPGNFTGLRVGLALARGIGMGLGIPVVGVCSLAAIACAIRVSDVNIRFVARDARRGELFCAAFASDGGTSVAPCLVSVAKFESWLESHLASFVRQDEKWALVGDGVKHLNAASLAERGAFVTDDAISLAPIACQTALLGSQMDVSQSAMPEYVRDADAVLPNLPRNSLIRSLVADDSDSR